MDETKGVTRCLEMSASPAWLAAPATNARDTPTRIHTGGKENGTATTHQTRKHLQRPLGRTVLPAQKSTEI